MWIGVGGIGYIWLAGVCHDWSCDDSVNMYRVAELN